MLLVQNVDYLWHLNEIGLLCWGKSFWSFYIVLVWEIAWELMCLYVSIDSEWVSHGLINLLYMLDYKATQCIRQPPIFLGKNSGFKPLPVYKTTPLMVQGAPHVWLMVRNSITADQLYNGKIYCPWSAQLQVFLNSKMTEIWPWFLLV